MNVRRASCVVLLLVARPALAQDPSGTWRTLHTQHFRIHFRPVYRARAVEAAREAERAYRLLSSELHPPRGIIDVTLSDDVDAANGFTTVFPSNRFTIFLTPPVTDPTPTAPPPPKRKASCSCGRVEPAVAENASSDD